MSFAKKNIVKINTKSNSKLSETKREKLLAIQERQQLKGLLVNKFLEKYGKEKKVNSDSVNRHVNEFMKNEKVTEENLKKLEQRIREEANIKSQPALSQKGEEVVVEKAPSVHSAKHEHHKSQGHIHAHHHHHHHHHHEHDDALSVASSDRPRSVYAQGDEDDEWATMLRYDAELFKKEKELEKAREQETKRKIKEELDRQLEQKRRMKEGEDDELRRYVALVGRQMNEFDRKENKKDTEMKNKIMNEKQSRDRQLQEENLRKRMERKNEKEMDELLVRQIKNELNLEAQQFALKRQEDRENFKRVLIENEERKRKMMDDARREKDNDIKAQKEYTRLIEKQEADRAAEFKAREDRAKQFMSLMADTVVKDQKAQILEEERKLLQQYMDKEARDAEEDRRRQQRLTDQKKEVKKFLDLQMLQKERRREEEREVGRKQAEIWKKDTDDYNTHEHKKAEFVKDVNMHHAEFLKKQIEEERKRNKKMSKQELLLNKPKLKEIADKVENIPFHKQLVSPHRY